jgi:LacI family transcriptional regulator
MNKATIYDVARDAGVGISTVSRVLNDSPNVNPETRERVQASIEKLQFYPNANARGLTSSKTTTIGIMVPFFMRYFFMDILLGIGDELINHGYDMLLFNVDELSRKNQIIKRIIGERKISGLISISLPIEDEEFKELQMAKIPLVLLDSHHEHANSIYMDNVEGAYKGVSHLITQGHTNIGMINGSLDTPFMSRVAKDRLSGYKKALRDAGIEYDRELVKSGDWHKFGGYEAAEWLLSLPKPPTAFFCASDIMALGALEKVKKRGIRIPEDFGIVGYDDMEFAQYAGLSSLRQPLDILGEMGTKILLGAIAENKYKKQCIRVEAELIARESSVKERRGTQQTDYNTGAGED